MVEGIRQATLAAIELGRTLAGSHVEKGDSSPIQVANYFVQCLVLHAANQAFPHAPMIAEEDDTYLKAMWDEGLRHSVERYIQRMYPQFVLSDVCRLVERSARVGHPLFQVSDPIGGTESFLRQNGDHWSSQWCLVDGGRIIVAIMACPTIAGGILLYARERAGCWVMPLTGGGWRRIQVSTCRRLSRSRLVMAANDQNPGRNALEAKFRELGNPNKILNSWGGTPYALVATGRVDAFLRLPPTRFPHLQIWDHAPGMLLVTEAGGQVSDVDGISIFGLKPEKWMSIRGVIATNTRLHQQLVRNVEF